jgi:6-phosphogluconolactonase
VNNASWLAASEDGRRLYAVSEQEKGAVSSYAVDRRDGSLSLLAAVPSGGSGPVHLSLHGRFAYVSHYGSGHLAVLPVAADGALGAPIQQLTPRPGRASHAHMALVHGQGRHVIATDLGQDLVTLWRRDPERGLLSDPQSLSLPQGSGPRHLAIHPRQSQLIYLLSETASTLTCLELEAGHLKQRGEAISSLPAGFKGLNYASDLKFSRDGRHLYALNRLHDAITIFALDEAGVPRWQGEAWTRGSYPRSCALDPAGEHLYVCNQRSDQITVFRVGSDGGLSFTGDYLPLGSPAAIAFMA